MLHHYYECVCIVSTVQGLSDEEDILYQVISNKYFLRVNIDVTYFLRVSVSCIQSVPDDEETVHQVVSNKYFLRVNY